MPTPARPPQFAQTALPQSPCPNGWAPFIRVHLGQRVVRPAQGRSQNTQQQNTTEEANDKCRTPDDSTAKDEHSDHNRTTPATRQAPAWAPFTFQGLSCQLRRAAHGRFVKARPPRPISAPAVRANRRQAVQSSRRRKRTRDRAGASRGKIGGTMAHATKCAAREENRRRDE